MGQCDLLTQPFKAVNNVIEGKPVTVDEVLNVLVLMEVQGAAEALKNIETFKRNSKR